MNKLFIVLLIFLIFINDANAKTIVLTNHSIGSMSIKPQLIISLEQIAHEFPHLKVSHKIASGDSPDFHAFTVSNSQNEALFTFISTISDKNGYKQSQVMLDEIIIHSDKIKDQYGVSVGQTLSEVMEKRKNMAFGDSHMGNFMGNDKIWYLFEVENRYSVPVSKEAAIKANPPIDAISWPHPIWR